MGAFVHHNHRHRHYCYSYRIDLEKKRGKKGAGSVVVVYLFILYELCKQAKLTFNIDMPTMCINKPDFACFSEQLPIHRLLPAPHFATPLFPNHDEQQQVSNGL